MCLPTSRIAQYITPSWICNFQYMTLLLHDRHSTLGTTSWYETALNRSVLSAANMQDDRLTPTSNVPTPNHDTHECVAFNPGVTTAPPCGHMQHIPNQLQCAYNNFCHTRVRCFQTRRKYSASTCNATPTSYNAPTTTFVTHEGVAFNPGVSTRVLLAIQAYL